MGADQINQAHFAILLLERVEVQTQIQPVVHAAVDAQWRLDAAVHERLGYNAGCSPPVGALRPEERHGAADLHVRRTPAIARHNLLRLNEVGHIAVQVNAAPVKARAWRKSATLAASKTRTNSGAAPARDEREVDVVAIDDSATDGHKAEHDRQGEGRELQWR